MSSNDDEDIEYDQPKPFAKSGPGPLRHTLAKYNSTYQQFIKWKTSTGNHTISEDVLLEYFTDLATRSKPTTLFAIYSMLKSTFRSNEGIDISNYSRLLEYLKEKNAGYRPIKAKAFTDDEIERFVSEAPDDRWLDVKVNCRVCYDAYQTFIIRI